MNKQNKIRISKQLPDNACFTVNQFMRENKGIKSEASVVEFVRKKFDAAKWLEITSLECAIERGSIDYRSKKKRDLGSDHLHIIIRGNKYVTAMFTPSNSNKTTRKYYELYL